jgi:hypothetical protein
MKLLGFQEPKSVCDIKHCQLRNSQCGKLIEDTAEKFMLKVVVVNAGGEFDFLREVCPNFGVRVDSRRSRAVSILRPLSIPN